MTQGTSIRVLVVSSVEGLLYTSLVEMWHRTPQIDWETPKVEVYHHGSPLLKSPSQGVAHFHHPKELNLNVSIYNLRWCFPSSQILLHSSIMLFKLPIHLGRPSVPILHRLLLTVFLILHRLLISSTHLLHELFHRLLISYSLAGGRWVTLVIPIVG